MSLIILIIAVLLAAYCVLILMYRRWFLRLPVFISGQTEKPACFFSVIIPARNEEQNIPTCLLSALQQQYPTELFEVIFINDHSTDRTEELVRQLQQRFSNLVLLNLADELQDQKLNSYKKKSIELAISKSRGNWIVCTDADCLVGPDWLSNFDAFARQGNKMFIAAPVMFSSDGSFLSLFQQLDFLSLQGITAASVSAGYHTMCNGANIAYQKKAFVAVNGFEGIDRLASGDDMLLMHKIGEKYPGALAYLFAPGSIVITEPMKTWKELLNQRIRWASKADSYRDRSIFWVLFLVYALNFGLLALLVVSPFIVNGFGYWLLLVIIKTMVELSFMVPVTRFFGQTAALGWFPIMQPFHIAYTVIAGWLGKFGTYEWKGRKVK
ncbi:MAG: glycosyltransferase [Chitinophagaceae bacterium]|nr:glycosyltransferase [Chitinophagaceae bacterium]